MHGADPARIAVCAAIPIAVPDRRPRAVDPSHPGRRDSDVTAIAILGLMVLALYLGSRWINSSAENAELRARIAALKRELARRRG